MVRIAFLGAAVLGLGVYACSSTDEAPADDTKDASSPPVTSDASDLPDEPADDAAVDAGHFLPPVDMPAGYTEIPIPDTEPKRKFAAAESVLVADQDYVAVLETTAGRIVLDLYETKAPLAVNSFVFLALHRFHEGQAFHRVIEDFVAQTGDPKTITGKPSTWGTGGPGYQFGLEVTPGLGFDRAGVLGMARGDDPGSNGSQFFITLADASFLSQQYTVWGGVLEGLETLPSIVRGESWVLDAGAPQPTRIIRVGIGSKPGAVDPPLSDAGPAEPDDAGPNDAGPDAGDASL